VKLCNDCQAFSLPFTVRRVPNEYSITGYANWGFCATDRLSTSTGMNLRTIGNEELRMQKAGKATSRPPQSVLIARG
jgi:hypothetical protein